MAQKMRCRACASYTTAITSALRDDEPCPHCGAALITGRATTLTLTDFLLAQFAEDEERAKDERHPRFRHIVWSADRGTTLEDHVLAECEAKRRIVELRETIDQEVRRIALDDFERATDMRATRLGLDAAIKLLALPYADHPDMREEWRA